MLPRKWFDAAQMHANERLEQHRPLHRTQHPSPSAILMPSTDPLTLLPSLREAVREAWVSDSATTLRGLAARMGIATPHGQPTYPLRKLVQRLQYEGVLHTEQQSVGRAFVAWNWSGQPLAGGQTLASVLDAFLSAPLAAADADQEGKSTSPTVACIRKADRELAKEALRKVLVTKYGALVAGTRTDDALLRAAVLVPAQDLRLLPGFARELQDPKRNELARGIRNLLRWAFNNDLIPVHVRVHETVSPWGDWLDQRYPLGPMGTPEYAAAQAVRTGLYAVQERCIQIYGHAAPRSPDVLTTEQATAALQAIEPESQQSRLRDKASSALRRLGLDGVGPWRALAQFTAMRPDETGHWVSYFVVPSPSAPSKESAWDDIKRLVVELGLPSEWVLFVDWYAAWSSLSLDDLRERWGATFQRAAKRRLNEKTLHHRVLAFRYLLGVLLNVHRLPPELCTLARVFGAEFPETVVALKSSWKSVCQARTMLEKTGVPAPGHDISPESPFLALMIVNAGMWAEGCAEWADWKATHPLPSDPAISVLDKSTRTSLRDSYQYAGRELKTGELSLNRRIHRDVNAIMQDVPTLALLPRHLERLRGAVESIPEDRNTAEMAQSYLIAYLTGSGMMRVGEPPLLRLGTHDRQCLDARSGRIVLRYFHLDAAERKGGSQNRSIDHDVPLIQELVPDWLYRYWTERGRGVLMAPHDESHDYFFVTPTTGTPLGGYATSAREQANRAGAASATARGLFRDLRLAELTAQGYRLQNSKRGHHTPHAERARVRRLFSAARVDVTLQSQLLGHRGKSTADRYYNSSLAEENAEILRRLLPALKGTSDASAAEESASAGRKRRASRSNAEVAQLALAHRLQTELLGKLESMSPMEAYNQLQALARVS